MGEAAWDILSAIDETGAQPALQFLMQAPSSATTKINAVLDAVAKAPPPQFSGGGLWKPMHAEMAGFYEVTVRYQQFNYRVLCVLDRKRESGSAIVMIFGFRKPVRSAAKPRDYDLALEVRDHYRQHQTAE